MNAHDLDPVFVILSCLLVPLCHMYMLSISENTMFWLSHLRTDVTCSLDQFGILYRLGFIVRHHNACALAMYNARSTQFIISLVDTRDQRHVT